MFQNLAAMLTGRQWGNRVKVDGKTVDTGVQELAEQLATMFDAMSKSPISITQPIVIQNYSGQPAFVVHQLGGDARALETRMPDGTQSSIGVGLGNIGIVANEVVPDINYALETDNLTPLQSQGRGQGEVIQTPGAGFESGNPKNTGFIGGTGRFPANMPPEEGVGGGEVGHGYKTHGGAIGPGVEMQVGTGGGAGSGGNFPGEGGSGGGGGSTVRVGQAVGHGVPMVDQVREAIPGITQTVAGFRPDTNGDWTFRWKGVTFYVPRAALSGGITGSQSIVTSVSCYAGVLSVTTKTLTYVNGIITDIS